MVVLAVEATPEHLTAGIHHGGLAFHGLRVLYAWTEAHAAAVCRVGFDAVAVETSVCRVQRREQVVAHNRGGKRVGSQIGLHGHERQASAWQVGQVEQLERTDRTTLGGCYGRE